MFVHFATTSAMSSYVDLFLQHARPLRRQRTARVGVMDTLLELRSGPYWSSERFRVVAGALRQRELLAGVFELPASDRSSP